LNPGFDVFDGFVRFNLTRELLRVTLVMHMNCINRIATSLSLALMLLALPLGPGTALSQTNPPASSMPGYAPSHAAPLDQSNAERIKQRWILSTLIAVLLGIGAAYLVRKPQNGTAK
jgi:hypothetical protein